MPDREKVIKDLEFCVNGHFKVELSLATKILALLNEQDELLKHEYWHGYNNGRADERGLQEGTIMQTFSPD